MVLEINKKRIRKLNDKDRGDGSVVYWMSRDQRTRDNWALLTAQKIAREEEKELRVVFNLIDGYKDAPLRHYDFMIKGMKEVEEDLNSKRIYFDLLQGEPVQNLKEYIKAQSVGTLVTDFSPLRVGREWRDKLAEEIDIAMYEVDAHNIVPCWVASDKQEYAARTIRKKINSKLDEFLVDFPDLDIHNLNNDFKESSHNWDKIIEDLDINREVKPVDWIKPGMKSAAGMLGAFIKNRLDEYDDKRNDPNEDVLSNLSPYYHYGQIAPQRVALAVKDSSASKDNIDAYLEELIVRRELSDNFCYYNENYDNFEGFSDWAKKSLNKHRDDEREYVYTKEEFENADTHEDLWNASQMQMVKSGKMHGYMRMYWAKKILEWSESPEKAMDIAIYLNDKYELDGRDPNGYVGVAWSIGGIHDRGWTEREVYGKIRYMNRNGAKRKFDIDNYVNEWLTDESN
jgi:deoxyribodipyrimidine photo-lyase